MGKISKILLKYSSRFIDFLKYSSKFFAKNLNRSQFDRESISTIQLQRDFDFVDLLSAKNKNLLNFINKLYTRLLKIQNIASLLIIFDLG